MSVPGQTSATDATEAVNQQQTENVVGGTRCNTLRVSGSVVTNFLASYMLIFRISNSTNWESILQNGILLILYYPLD